MPTSSSARRLLAVALTISLAASPSTAATLKWRPYRPANAAERAAFAKPVEGTRLASKKAEKQTENKVVPAAAVSPAEDNPLADPFQDGLIAARQNVDEALDGLNLDDESGTRRETTRPKAEVEPDPFKDDAESVPDSFPSETSPPEKLAPEEDYFPEERVPEMKRDTLKLPNEEPVPENGSPSFSDELRELESPGPTVSDCKSEKADCADAIAKLKANTLANIELDINVNGVEGQDFPCECPFGEGETFLGRNWTCVTYNWKASGLCHKPLYFEQVAVERYGHSMPTLVQDVICGAHFFASIPALPYMMGLCPPDECQYSLGYYRPGNCAPYLIDPIPLSLRAGLFQAGAIVGGILIIP